MMKQMMMTAAAVIMLAAGNAQARLGWTLDDCQNLWGAPVKVAYNSSLDQTSYVFRAQSNLWTQVWLLNGHVQSINYCSSDKDFLVSNAPQLLQKNYSGVWSLYDDARGKRTLKSWQITNADGVIVYAVLWNKSADANYYWLQVSTSLWGSFLNNHGVGQASNVADLNI